MPRRVNYDKKWAKKSKGGEQLLISLLKIIALTISALFIGIYNLIKFLFRKYSKPQEKEKK